MMKRCICVVAACSGLFGQEHPTGSRLTPPTVASVTPRGVARGTTLELTVEGFNLAKASAIYFNKGGIKGRIVRVKELPDASETRLGSNGTLATMYFDDKTGLLVRTVRHGRSPIGRVPTQVDYADYRDVGGVKFPYKWLFIWMDGRDTFEFSDVKLNVTIPAATFGQPDVTVAAPR